MDHFSLLTSERDLEYFQDYLTIKRLNDQLFIIF